MNGGDAVPDDEDVSIYVCAPSQNDASLIATVLANEGLASRQVLPREVESAISDQSVLVCTQEGLTFGLRETLRKQIRHQPPWARFPIVLLLNYEQNSEEVIGQIYDIMVGGHVTVLHRPVKPLEFRTAITNAVTARHRQLEIRDHIDHEVELRRELNHRVKNTVATFHAIYRMTLRQSSSLEDFSGRFAGRLRALTAVHELLHGAGEEHRALDETVDAVLAPYRGDHHGRIVAEGLRVTLGQDAALALALVLNELATNAAKYGALSNETGTVKIAWKESEHRPGKLELTWREIGGPAVVAPSHRGYGTRFITGSIAALGGTAELNYHADGLEVVMTVPILALGVPKRPWNPFGGSAR